MNTHFIPSRRTVLKSGGALIVGFSFAGPIAEALAQGATADKPLALTEVDTFLSIDAKGMVTIYSGKIDFGTGVRTALMQIAADELDVPFTSVKVIEGDTALTPDQGKTWASVTIQIGGLQLRNAAATARQALVAEAAKRLGAKPEDVKIVDGVAIGRRQEGQLRRIDRRQELFAQARPHQAHDLQGSEGLQAGGPVGAARRHPRQMHRAFHLYA